VGEVFAPSSVRWMLVGRRASADERSIPTGTVLGAVARRGLPHLFEATLVPAILFVAVGAAISPRAAMITVFAWAFGAIARRRLAGAPVPALLLLSTFGLVVRTGVGLASGSTFAYFLQPVATTVGLAVMFAGSVLLGRPLIARLAHDFVPLHPDVAGRPAIARLFAGLTLLWAGVHVLTAAATFSLLVTLPTPAFVALKTGACAAISAVAIAITVVLSLRTARREHLVFQEA
jgi:hypothetical protein